MTWLRGLEEWAGEEPGYELSRDAVADRYERILALLQEGAPAEQWVLGELVARTVRESFRREAAESGMRPEEFSAALLLIAAKAGLALVEEQPGGEA